MEILMQTLNSLGERLKWARKNAGLSQGQLENLVGLPQSVISRLERDPTSETRKIVELATACQVNPYWLATGKGDVKSVTKSIQLKKLELALEKYKLTQEEIDTVERYAIERANEIFLQKYDE